MNGLLGDTNLNNHRIEETIMRTWCEQDYLLILPHLTGHWTKFTEQWRELFARMHGLNRDGEPVPVSAMNEEEKQQRARRLDVSAQLRSASYELTAVPAAVPAAAPAAVHAAPAAAHREEKEEKQVAVASGAAAVAPWVGLAVSAKRRQKNSSKVKGELQAALRALLVVAPASGAEAASDVTNVHVRSYRSSSALRFFGDILGTRSSRRHRCSWVMMRTGTHVRPARLENFVEAEVCCTRGDGTTSDSKHLLVQIR
jgi:hypothetical protein